MIDALIVALGNLLILLVLLTTLWFISVQVKDASIIDIAWGPACALPAVLTFFRTDGGDPRAFVLTMLVCIWAARLALYLAQRNLGHGEDIRYRKMRAQHDTDSAFARWSLPFIYWLQGVIAWFVSLPVQLGQFGENGFGVLAWIGVLIFCFGLGFEAVGDWQLKRFKADPANAGKLMTQGLWSWTRHPNYFGDATVWTGLTLISFEGSYGIWTVLSPVVMTYFLVNVSGKAMTERAMERKYPDYADYKQRVSGFIPAPPKTAS